MYYAIRKGFLIAEGTLVDVVFQVFNWFVDEDGVLHIRPEWSSKRVMHSYATGKFTYEEILNDVTQLLASKAKEYDIVIAKRI